MEDAADRYQECDEDDTDRPSISAFIISIPQLDTDLANKSQATTPESEIFHSLAIATSHALSHLDALVTFFEALPASDLEPSGQHSITLCSVARPLGIFRSGVNQLNKSKKRQGILDKWLKTVTVKPSETISHAAAPGYADR